MNTIQNENWKEIPGYSNYMISDYGRVMAKNYKRTGLAGVMSPGIMVNGYLNITLVSDEGVTRSFGIHRLVLSVFAPCENMNTMQADHINSKRDDNRLTNLRWLSRKDNNSTKHARIMKRRNAPDTHIVLAGICLRDADGNVFYFRTMNDAADYIGCSRIMLHHALDGITAHHACGYEVFRPITDTDKKNIEALIMKHRNMLKKQNELKKLQKKLKIWMTHTAIDMKITYRKIEILSKKIAEIEAELNNNKEVM